MKKEELRGLLMQLREGLLKYRYAVIVLLAGILLLSIGHGEDKGTAVAETDRGRFDLEAFEAAAAKQLSQIAGVGKLELMLTLETTEEAVYASDTRESISGGQTGSREESLTVVSGRESGQTPVTVKELYPTFRGAVVLCEGADDVHVRSAVIEAISTLCGIRTDKVAVLKMESGE